MRPNRNIGDIVERNVIDITDQSTEPEKSNCTVSEPEDKPLHVTSAPITAQEINNS